MSDIRIYWVSLAGVAHRELYTNGAQGAWLDAAAILADDPEVWMISAWPIEMYNGGDIAPKWDWKRDVL